MRNSILVITSIAMLATTPVLAADSPKEERIGVGGGALLGAIAAGPVGLIVGATIGAKIGDTLHQKNESIETLAVSLENSRGHVADLNHDVDALGDELDRLRTGLRRKRSPDTAQRAGERITELAREVAAHAPAVAPPGGTPPTVEDLRPGVAVTVPSLRGRGTVVELQSEVANYGNDFQGGVAGGDPADFRAAAIDSLIACPRTFMISR